MTLRQFKSPRAYSPNCAIKSRSASTSVAKITIVYVSGISNQSFDLSHQFLDTVDSNRLIQSACWVLQAFLLMCFLQWECLHPLMSASTCRYNACTISYVCRHLLPPLYGDRCASHYPCRTTFFRFLLLFQIVRISSVVRACHCSDFVTCEFSLFALHRQCYVFSRSSFGDSGYCRR
jgi:hypothetical protein